MDKATHFVATEVAPPALVQVVRNNNEASPPPPEVEQSAETAAAIHDANTRLVKVSEVLQTAARALQQVIDSKLHAEEEAQKWKKKYEELHNSLVHRTERVVQESVGGQVVRQEKTVTYRPQSESVSLVQPATVAAVQPVIQPAVVQQISQPGLVQPLVVPTVVQGGVLQPVEVAPSLRKTLFSQKALRSKSIPASSYSNSYDYRTVVQHPEPPQYGKVSFRLAWISEDDKTSQYQQDVVTFESGNIRTPTCNNKQIILVWDSPPQCVCILTKPNCPAVHNLCKEMIAWLHSAKLSIYVEPHVRKEMLAEDLSLTFLHTWDTDEELCFLHNKIDLLVTLGGDGTVLWAASLFRGPVPPLVPFAMGTLGFMTPFQSDRYKECLLSVMRGPAYITIRHRLHCRIIRHSKRKKEQPQREREEVYIVLNEVAIDRGMSSFLTNLECYCDNIFVTNVQGDGLIVSTPSGSTAYSLSAGGSMVHPQVAAMLFTPICPHSLSFRPLILPEHVTLRIQVPEKSRGDAWVAFDGRERLQLGCGDALVCHLSSWPVPTACTVESTNAFLQGVKEGLYWNMRKIQGARDNKEDKPSGIFD